MSTSTLSRRAQMCRSLRRCCNSRSPHARHAPPPPPPPHTHTHIKPPHRTSPCPPYRPASHALPGLRIHSKVDPTQPARQTAPSSPYPITRRRDRAFRHPRPCVHPPHCPFPSKAPSLKPWGRIVSILPLLSAFPRFLILLPVHLSHLPPAVFSSPSVAPFFQQPYPQSALRAATSARVIHPSLQHCSESSYFFGRSLPSPLRASFHIPLHMPFTLLL
ncbi:hypothetical protein B0H17DRAFT_511379 [Mycena rosella]|uniref:Uncharacterized protein n=1 Tax=Mycena rosella TaxID=1033263 RepID=A0AAD7BY70_MYCRO|nr:hypothetical protein B0H17DRAFT_511379 [Mycena rosella]